MAQRITVKHVETALQRLVHVLAQRDPTAKLRSRYGDTGYFVERLYGARYRIVREVAREGMGDNVMETHPFGEHARKAGEMYEAINFAIQVIYTERESIDRQMQEAIDRPVRKFPMLNDGPEFDAIEDARR